MRTLDLATVFFKLEIEDVFSIPGRSKTVVAGRVATGAIHDKAAVVITTAAGEVVRTTRIMDLEWLDRRRCGEHVTADAGMNVAVVFEEADEAFLRPGHYLVIETRADFNL